MKATYDETILMDRLLLSARAVLTEQESVAAGHQVSITIHHGEQAKGCLYPWRVAAYAYRALGAPGLVGLVSKVSFSSKGITQTVAPSYEGYEAFRRVLLAHIAGEQRKSKRLRGKLQAQIRRNEAKINRPLGGEGGASL